MIVLIDNYDSFTYNLVQLIEEVAGEPVDVIRNDAYEVDRLLDSAPTRSSSRPGPGLLLARARSSR